MKASINSAETSKSFPIVKEEKLRFALYREEVAVNGKDGQYPAIQATFAALKESEKQELFRLVEALGSPKEQLISILNSFLRHSVIVLIYNKERTKVVATGLVGLMMQFGSQEIGITRLGSFAVAYAFVDPEYRGRYLGKELLRLRFNLLKNNYFHKYIQQTSVNDLKLNGQKIDDKKVTKQMLLKATQRNNLIVYCDLKDKEAHFGRCVEAAENVGMTVTPIAEKLMKQFAQLTVEQFDDYLLLHVYIGIPDENVVNGKKRLSRRNETQYMYIFGNRELREQIAKQIDQRLIFAGAKYQEIGSFYFGCDPEEIWTTVLDLISSKEYKVILNQPRTPETIDKFRTSHTSRDNLLMVAMEKEHTYRFAAGFPK